MRESTIGIKIADGTYYPVIEEHKKGKKKLILTTVNNEQTSVQIDLYRGDGPEIAAAQYVGSLVIDNIEPAPRGTPEIELIIGLDDQGNLNASASDKVTGEGQSLSVSLETLTEGGIYEVPEFELEEQFVPSPDLEWEEEPLKEITPEESLADEIYAGEEQGELSVTERRKTHPLILVAFIVLGLIIIVLLAFLIFRLFQGPSIPPLFAKNGEPSVKTEQVVEQSATTVAEAVTPIPSKETEKSGQAQPETEVKPIQETEAQAGSAAPEKGVWYRIKWGDTLWDLSSSFYRTPWLYGKIAKKNQIKNPDLIFAGTTIFIPEQ
ncbi:MAG: Hsp70 family protein [Spirochaetota bacterium]